MKKISRAGAAVFLGLFLWALPAAAETISIENHTGQDVVRLYTSNHDANTWEEEENVLGGRILAVGDSIKVDLNRRFMMYDLKAVFADGSERPYYGVNIRKFTRVRLNPGGADLIP